jgi:hypothetical protein
VGKEDLGYIKRSHRNIPASDSYPPEADGSSSLLLATKRSFQYGGFFCFYTILYLEASDSYPPGADGSSSLLLATRKLPVWMLFLFLHHPVFRSIGFIYLDIVYTIRDSSNENNKIVFN